MKGKNSSKGEEAAEGRGGRRVKEEINKKGEKRGGGGERGGEK